MPSAHAAGGASLPCGVTGTGTISCTQNYAAFIPGGSCVVASTSLSFPNGSNSSGFEHLYAGSSVLNTCNGTANWGTIGSYAAVVCNPGSQILAPSCEDRARFEFVIRDGTIHATSAGTISVGGDFYLYGFLQNSGFIQKNPLPGSGQGLGTVSTNDATLTVWTKLINSATGSPIFTWQEQSFQPSPCTGTGGTTDWNCLNILKLNSDYAFSHSANLPSAGNYYLEFDVLGDAHSVAAGYSAAQTWVCLSTYQTVCYTPPNPTYPGSTSCPAGVPQNPCYFFQWKYSTYSLTGQFDPPSPDFVISANPASITLTGYPTQCATFQITYLSLGYSGNLWVGAGTGLLYHWQRPDGSAFNNPVTLSNNGFFQAVLIVWAGDPVYANGNTYQVNVNGNTGQYLGDPLGISRSMFVSVTFSSYVGCGGGGGGGGGGHPN